MPAQGLSPRVRGNLPGGTRRFVGARSIPACAGEPWKDWGKADRCKVYPRVCGGTDHTAGEYVNAVGLSPRVRGNRIL